MYTILYCELIYLNIGTATQRSINNFYVELKYVEWFKGHVKKSHIYALLWINLDENLKKI
jgi:hypothetical protein